MKDAFMSMGPFGKVLAVIFIAGTVRYIACEIATTVKNGKATKAK